MAYSTVHIDANGGYLSSTAPLTLYYFPGDRYWHTSSTSFTIYNRVTAVAYPSKPGFRCLGYAFENGVYLDHGGSLYPASQVLPYDGATAYAQWQRHAYKITLDQQDGEYGTTELYAKVGESGLYSDVACNAAAGYIAPPTRGADVFGGYWTAPKGAAGAQKCINADGSVTSEFAQRVFDDDVTLYAHWGAVYTITVDAWGGEGGTGEFYYNEGLAAFVASPTSDEAITSITPPTKFAAEFLGCIPDGSTPPVVDADGVIQSSWTPTEDVTISAMWRTLVGVTLDNGGGIGQDALEYDSSAGGYRIPGESSVVTSVDVPIRECFAFLGYFSAASGGTQYIDEHGDFTAAFTALDPDAAFIIYAQWRRVSYKATIYSDTDGATPCAFFYCDGATAEFYNDDLLETSPVEGIVVPTRTGYAFAGAFTEADGGGAQVVAADGEILCGAFPGDVSYYAAWEAKSYTLTFDYSGGSGPVTSKPVTWGEAVGALPIYYTPPANLQNPALLGWLVGGVQITAETVWGIDADATAFAKWATAFAYVEDFFGLGSATLVPFESDAGDNRRQVITRHYGKFKNTVQGTANEGASGSSSKTWRNPTVKYMVVGDMTFAVQLGKAFAATAVATGYMITSATVDTRAGQFPVVTVQGTANEGADAINLFGVSVPIAARARAQNLLGAVSGGGELQTCSLRATCDPVVLAEKMMPCASDVVGGRYELHAETLAAHNESAPTTAGASGFALIAAPDVGAGTNYRRYRLTARKEIW